MEGQLSQLFMQMTKFQVESFAKLSAQSFMDILKYLIGLYQQVDIRESNMLNYLEYSRIMFDFRVKA